MIDPEKDPIGYAIQKVLDYQDRFELADTTFGARAAGNSAAVVRIRNGGGSVPSLRKLWAFMRANPDGPDNGIEAITSSRRKK